MMRRYPRFRLALLAVIASVVLSACLPEWAGRLEPGSGRPRAAGEVAVEVAVTPLDAPAFGAPPVTGPETPAAPAATTVPLATSAAPLAAEFDAATATAWFDLAYSLARDEKLAPPLVARIFGYTGVALYEAVAPGIPGATSLAGQLNELTPLPQPDPQAAYHWPAVANAALGSLMRTLLADGSSEAQRAIQDLERRLQAEFAANVAPDVLQRSIAQGQLVGLAVFDWAQADGFAYLNNCDYISPSGPGLWTATPPGYAAPLQPCWGQMRPFVLRERSDECQPAQAAPVYSEEPSSQFFYEALEVYQTGKNLTPQQVEIARFWSDDAGKTGTPPGHSVSILTQLVRDQELTLDAAAEAYARLGVALADAFISCWQTKFATHTPRPITYIHDMFDPAWTPLIITPPFPEYTSGHSVQSGAAAAVLTALFGEDVAFTDHTHDALGFAPRSFASFAAMADEAAISRLYGGIHYRSAIENGLAQGACIGERVNALKYRP